VKAFQAVVFIHDNVVCTYQETEMHVKLIGAILILIDIVVGTFIFINLIVAVAANTLVSLHSENYCCLISMQIRRGFAFAPVCLLAFCLLDCSKIIHKFLYELS